MVTLVARLLILWRMTTRSCRLTWISLLPFVVLFAMSYYFGKQIVWMRQLGTKTKTVVWSPFLLLTNDSVGHTDGFMQLLMRGIWSLLDSLLGWLVGRFVLQLAIENVGVEHQFIMFTFKISMSMWYDASVTEAIVTLSL